MKNLLHSYQNGNVSCSIYEDGTLIREYEGEPKPIHACSIDVKITNYCDAGCGYCHEMSTRIGKHGDLDFGVRVLTQLPAGVEIAIGGGNPLDHPLLMPFLDALRSHGLIANITVNQIHLARFKDRILALRNEKFIYGLGISYQRMSPIFDDFMHNNTVFHLIMGVHTIKDLKDIQDKYPSAKVLLLGYKQVGRGIGYFDAQVEANIKEWYMRLPDFFNSRLTLSFDNLGIKQMNMQRFFTNGAWNEFYMGDDGTFTMYMDLVSKTYAVSSTNANKIPMTGSITDMFAHVRSMNHE